MELENHIAGSWVKGNGKQAELIDSNTDDLIGTTSSDGLYFFSMR